MHKTPHHRSYKYPTLHVWCLYMVFVFYASYFFDGVNKFFQYSHKEEVALGVQILSVSKYFRAMVQFSCISFALFYRPNIQKVSMLILMTILSICFLLGALSYASAVGNAYDFGYHVSFLFKYLYLPVIFLGLYEFKNTPVLLKRLENTVSNIFLINSLLCIVGLFLNIGYFKSYYNQDFRYGYNGLLPAANEATLFSIVAISWVYYKVFVTNAESLNTKNILILCGNLLLGAKGLYFFVFMLMIFHFFKKETIWRKMIFVSLSAGILVSLLIFFQSEYAHTKLEFFYRQVEDGRGLLTMLMSDRNIYLATKFVYNIKEWTFLNYLFGGQNMLIYLIEMDFFDTFLFFGMVGTVLYLVLLFFTFYMLNQRNHFYHFFVFNYAFFALMGGHFMYSALNSVYIVVFLLYVYMMSKKHTTSA